MKPEQPGPHSYTPRSSSTIEFQFRWNFFRVNAPNTVELEDFPFYLEPQQNGYSIPFLEFRSLFDPPSDIGNPGDIWLNVSPPSYALFALNAKKEWVRWPGPTLEWIKWPGPTLDKRRMLPHPFLPTYGLWCTIKHASWYHCDNIGRDWTDMKLVARQKLGGYSSVESLLDASVGVRLIVLREETENSPFRPAKAPLATPRNLIGDKLKSAVRELASATNLLEVQEALIATLSSGIDQLLTERKKLSRALSEAEERASAATAELKLARLDTSSNHHNASCSVDAPTLQPSQKSPGSDRDPARMPSNTDTVQSSASNIITSKHLDILFRPADGGRSKNCLICLALITYDGDEDFFALMLHALGTHPSECSVFASLPDEQLELYRQELQ
ncbi:hypothetical protein K438DRAFT_1983593 [Mycena galopus ATCC 62051]|nr:hypothetical protein K438DRAFT_1983593 [Mycena galopus ATCC 62051]